MPSNLSGARLDDDGSIVWRRGHQRCSALERRAEYCVATNNHPVVSVIVPAFVSSRRQAQLLDETLATAADQSRRDVEVLVVDDGSSMDVGAIAARHPRTSTLRQENAGVAVARNSGIAASRGRFLAFLDADDHLLPGAIDKGLQALEHHPHAGFAVGALDEMPYEGAPVPWAVAAPPDQTMLYEPLLAFDWYIIPPSSVMFRREVVDAVGGFRDPWGADDLDFYLRAAWTFAATCHGSAVTRYRRYSTSSSRDGERMLRSIRAVYARQWPLVRGHCSLERAYHRGLQQLTSIFQDCLVENVSDRVREGQWGRALRSARVLAGERPLSLVSAARQAWSHVHGRR
jgi:glycosyltransferase involved in cell wall biosynthesis